MASGKIPVSVIAVYVGEGFEDLKTPASPALAAKYKVIPLKILTRNGEKIIVDRVIGISRKASTKAGGLGKRYACLATIDEIQREICVYKDNDDWYMEDEFGCVDGTY